MAFRSNAEAKPVEMLPGVVRRTLSSGGRMTLVEVTLEKGAVLPAHSHPHEQIGYIPCGRFIFKIGDEECELTAGDSYVMPANVPHSVTAIETGIAVDIFSPVREEYLDK